MTFDDLTASVRAATDPTRRRTLFHELGGAVELDPSRAALVQDLTAAWPAADRAAPPFTINKLVDGRLPYEALGFIGALRMFDLILDESTSNPARDDDRVRPFAARFAALRRWADAMPADLVSAVEHLDWSYAAWRSLPCRDPFDYVDDPPGLDFRALDLDTVLAVLGSPMCSRLRILNLSKGPWLLESLTIESDWSNAEDVMTGFMHRLDWRHLIALPCARTLEQLTLGGTDVHDNNERGWDFQFPTDAPPFPALRYLDSSVGRTNTTGTLLKNLVMRGAMPRLETLVLTDDLSPRIARALAKADDEERSWIEKHFHVSRIRALYLEDLGEGPASLRHIALGAALDDVRADLEQAGITVPASIELVASVEPPPDLVVPWTGGE